MKAKFTLIELLVVIAIIGILASMLLPSLQKARNQSMAAVCINNLHQQGAGFSMFHDDNSMFQATKFQNGTGDHPHEPNNGIDNIVEYVAIDSLFCPLGSFSSDDYLNPWHSEYVYAAHPEHSARKDLEGLDVVVIDTDMRITQSDSNSTYRTYTNIMDHNHVLWLDGHVKKVNYHNLYMMLWGRGTWR